MYKGRVLRAICIFAAIALALMMTACKADDTSRRAENEEKLLRVMTEYPGDGLYDPVVTVIGVGVPEPTEEERAEAEKKAAEEKQAWENAVGSCFADGMFDTFYGKYERLHVISMAFLCNLTTQMSDFTISDTDGNDSDNIEHALIKVLATDEKGETRSFDMDWMVTFDKDDQTLIQKIKLMDDGGYYDAYASSDDEEELSED